MTTPHPLARTSRRFRLSPPLAVVVVIGLYLVWRLVPNPQPPKATPPGESTKLHTSYLSTPPSADVARTGRSRQPQFAGLAAAPLIPSPPINGVLEHGNTLWCTTERGLQRIDNGKVTPVPGFPAPQGNALVADGTTLWIGTAFGLVGYDLTTTRFTTIRAATGLIHDIVWTLCNDGNTLWIGTQAGFSARTPSGRLDKIDPTVANRGLTGSVVAALAHRSGRLFVGTDEGLYCWQIDRGPSDAQAWTRVVLGNTVAQNWVTALATTSTHLWVGTVGGLARINDADPGNPAWITRAHGLPANRVTTLLADGDGAWIGTAAGLAFTDASGTITTPATQPPQFARGVRTLARATPQNNCIFIGTDAGLSVWHPE